MKKILLFLLILIIIPLIVINIFSVEKEIELIPISNDYIRIKRENGNIDKVYFEDYITGVLAGEMPVSFEKEALKAQAVAARSYAYNKLNETEDFDLVDTVDHQVYKDYDYLKKIWGKTYIEKINKLKNAVLETTGEYLKYNGEIIQAFYFSTSSGKTENGNDIFGVDAPYLKSVESKWDNISPVFTEIKIFTKKEFCEKLVIDDKKISIKEIVRTESGTIKNININNKNFEGVFLRNTLGLRSSNFEIIEEKNNIKIITKGYGHGVGMSQYGAQAMALEGYKYKEILKYYYQNIKIEKK